MRGCAGFPSVCPQRPPLALERASEKVKKLEQAGLTLVLISAIVGLPPFYLISLAAGAMRLNLAGFIAVGTVGRVRSVHHHRLRGGGGGQRHPGHAVSTVDRMVPGGAAVAEGPETLGNTGLSDLGDEARITNPRRFAGLLASGAGRPGRGPRVRLLPDVLLRGRPGGNGPRGGAALRGGRRPQAAYRLIHPNQS